MLGGDMLSDHCASATTGTSPSRRLRVPRLARKVLRWGLIGSAGCFLSWCAVTTMSTGTAEAATTNDTTIDSVVDQTPVDQTVDGVRNVVDTLAGQHDRPESAKLADADLGKAVAVPEAPSDQPAKDVLDDSVDRLTKFTTSLDALEAPGAGVVRGLSSSSDDGLTVAVPVASPDLGELSDAVPASAAPSGSPASTATTQVHRQGEVEHDRARAAHSNDAVVHVSSRAGSNTGSQGGSELPFSPVNNGAFGHAPVTGSAAGSSAFDGGTGARVTTAHLPFVTRSAVVPSLVGVEVPWSPADKPRVSPD